MPVTLGSVTRRRPRTSDLELRAASFTVLLITGPNTGGKTVALKTAGLLSLMAQAGLPVPADADTRLPVFDAVFADIGDEQSIEQSLSTFSSHMSNIITILSERDRRFARAARRAGAGHRPDRGRGAREGDPHRTCSTTGALAVATTHHGELKAFAHITPGVTNASVEFDPETLSPTYRLHIGLPGQRTRSRSRSGSACRTISSKTRARGSTRTGWPSSR